MMQYTRTTHNFNNDSREWEYRGFSDKKFSKKADWAYGYEKSPRGISAFKHGEWKTLVEIVTDNIDHWKQNNIHTDTTLKDKTIEIQNQVSADIKVFLMADMITYKDATLV